MSHSSSTSTFHYRVVVSYIPLLLAPYLISYYYRVSCSHYSVTLLFPLLPLLLFCFHHAFLSDSTLLLYGSLDAVFLLLFSLHRSIPFFMSSLIFFLVIIFFMYLTATYHEFQGLSFFLDLSVCLRLIPLLWLTTYPSSRLGNRPDIPTISSLHLQFRRVFYPFFYVVRFEPFVLHHSVCSHKALPLILSFAFYSDPVPIECLYFHLVACF